MRKSNNNKKKVICIIPARGGSKGIKNKNLQKIGGKSLISFPIRAAIKSNVCDKILVSTDSIQIAKEAKKKWSRGTFFEKKKIFWG